MELDKIPGMPEAIAAAEQKEMELREFAFSGLPENIGGLEVQQLRLPHLRLLSMIKSPFLAGGDIAAADIAAFLWIVSLDYKERDNSARDEFVKHITVMEANWIPEIRAYLDRAFIDAQSSGKSDHSPIAGTTACWLHPFASAYGWGLGEIEKYPIAALIQLSRFIERDINPKATFQNRLVNRARKQKLKEWKESQKDGR